MAAPSACPSCGSPITHAKTVTGENIPLEKHTDTSGPSRFVITSLGPPLIVQSVRADYTGDAYPDHRLECPDYGNGLQRP